MSGANTLTASPDASRAVPLGAIGRRLSNPTTFVAVMLVITVAGLALDRYANLGQQVLLSVAAWAFLLVALALANRTERFQTVVVIVVATAAEVFGSLILGAYEYRLANLPLFVPAGHGIVYLSGLRLSQTPWATAHRRWFIGAALAFLLGWAGLGLVVLERLDVAGAIGALILAAFLLRSRNAAIYAGVFFFVAFLEIYGTAVGTWTWAETIPWIGLPDGNPPSGAAVGYVLFDIAALTLAPHLMRGWDRMRGRPEDGRPSPAPTRAASRAREAG
jgi:hypothetical protein